MRVRTHRLLTVRRDRFVAGLAVGLALLAPTAFAQDADDAEAGGPKAVETVVGDHDGALDTFKDAQDRFRDRVVELETDTLAYLVDQRDRHLGALRRGYDERVDVLDAEEKAARGDAIASFERFLRRYDDVQRGSEVRLRLAELYFQEAEEAFFRANAAYYEALDAAGDDFDELARLEEQGPPKKDLSAVVRLLRTVVRANSGLAVEDQYALLDVAYYMLAFCYVDDNSAQQDREVARATFRELIAERPDSEYADAAHLMLGLYFFEDNDFVASIPEFQAVVDKGPSRSNFMSGLYQLAWARYKLSEYDEATARFVQLLDLSYKRERETGRRQEFVPDGIAYLALSLIDVADQDSVTPLESAQAFFGRVGAKPYRWEVLRDMAQSLANYDRPFDAVEIYERLQTDPAYTFRPENPEFQHEVVRLLSRGYDADLAAAGQARIVMTDRYGEGSPWWEANRQDPEALATARTYIESYLLAVAIELNVRAVESADPDEAKALFGQAAEKYREYLDRFPISDNYFENQFRLAETLFRAERYAESAEEDASLLRNARFHDFDDPAVVRLYLAREQLLKDAVGDTDKRAESAEVERTYTATSGKEITVYELLDVQKDLIESADQVVGHPFDRSAADESGVVAFIDANEPNIMYVAAQVLHYANRFGRSRPRLQKIIKEHPRTDAAARAANLFLNSYIAEGDTAAVRRWSGEFASMNLGAPTTSSDELAARFRDTYEKATYQVGIDAYAAGDYLVAAEAYLAFLAEFPDSENRADALLSAANSYSQAGKVAEANELYEQFITAYPSHPEARGFYLRIASNYEAVFEFDRAIELYEQYVRRFPSDPYAKDAQYNIALLNQGLGRYEIAAQGYQAYASKFSDADDAEATYFLAGDMWELVSASRALSFYKDYLRKYGLENPDHAVQAQGKVWKLSTRARDVESARKDTISMFQRASESGAKLNAKTRDVAASAAFPDLKAVFDQFLTYKLSRNEKRDTDMLLKTMRADMDAFSKDVDAFVDTYASFEFSTAAIYLRGAALKHYADTGFAVEPPAGLDPDMETAYWDLLEESLFPLMQEIEDAAEQVFNAVLNLAAEQKRHSEWVDEARSALNDIDPTTYPDVKTPIEGSVDAVEPPALSPLPPLEAP